jgi:DNA adenine methylase
MQPIARVNHSTDRARPFLKWAGGKQQLERALLKRAPQSVATYYEPFLGGGALFFALMSSETPPRRAVLNDMNPELVLTYKVVRDRLPELVERLGEMSRQYLDADDSGRRRMYYCVRGDQPSEAIETAARFIFLNKTCFNGLYRVNRSGQFNVPHGRYRSPTILDEAGLAAASAALQSAELTHSDFETACEDAARGDFVYFDPPFVPLSPTSSFTSYTKGDFLHKDQLRLKWCADRLWKRGVAVMLSNSAHDWVVGAYEGSHYRVERTPARRAINSKGDRRGAIDELIVTTDYPRRGQIDSLE